MEINNTQNITEMDSLEDLVSYLQFIDKVESTPIEETINISKVSIGIMFIWFILILIVSLVLS